MYPHHIAKLEELYRVVFQLQASENSLKYMVLYGSSTKKSSFSKSQASFTLETGLKISLNDLKYRTSTNNPAPKNKHFTVK